MARNCCSKRRSWRSQAKRLGDNLAYLYLEHLDNSDVAFALAQKGREKLPDSPAAADTLDWTYYKKGLHTLAISNFQECTQKVPDNPTYPFHLGMDYLADGHAAQGKQSLQKALRLSNDFNGPETARQALQSFP